MPKYTKEFKIKLVMKYLSGKSGGRLMVAKKYDIPDGTLQNWVDKYKTGGFNSLSKS
ncbi:helix-turn-helix domain-containing protein [Anaerococcus vaginalis]|uniref:helix-turn-helix domain-containing protein n=1 Tax=Anaerococcus vaginalis TaxID=33037 RepID=UPI0029135453|nr:helix-turn-helix domain-containing protein [Anaerococcus vaginalis]MDU6546615.1 helix-turn-helix domain-containing protein [Anaerococcus vaginalis]